MDERILITGATGFVGGGIFRRMISDGRQLRISIRQQAGEWPKSVETALVKSLEAETDWSKALAGISVVVHCAARAHVLKEAAIDPLAEFRRANEFGTIALARQAAESGVRRFIFLSSIGVNGNETFGKPFSADDRPQPTSAYAIAKHGAEIGLRQIAQETGMEIVIVRPPLVYGPNAPGNFGQLMNAVRRRLPLPLGRVDNNRSFVALDNLVDLVVTCVDHPCAGGHIFLVSDDEDVSTPEFIQRMGKAMDKVPFMLPIPVFCLHALARIAGREEQLKKLINSLQLDIRHTKEVLSWRPVICVDDALKAAVHTW